MACAAFQMKPLGRLIWTSFSLPETGSKWGGEFHLQDSRHGEAAALAIDMHLDGHKFGVELIAHRGGEDGECSVASRASIGDLGERVALRLGGTIGDVNPAGATALMNCPGP